MTKRYYRVRELDRIEHRELAGMPFVLTSFEHAGVRHRAASVFAEPGELSDALHALRDSGPELSEGEVLLADVYAWRSDDREATTDDELSARAEGAPCRSRPAGRAEPGDVRGSRRRTARGRTSSRSAAIIRASWSRTAACAVCIPLIAERLDLWRLTNFELERLPADQDVHLFRATARENDRDQRLVAVAEVRDMTPVRDERGRIVALPALERTARQAFEAMRTFQSRRRSRERLQWNRVMLYAWPAADFEADEARAVISRMGRMSAGLGLEMVMLRVRLGTGDGAGNEVVLRFFNPAGRGVVTQVDPLPTEPLQTLDDGAQRIVTARRRGQVHPAEILKLLAPPRQTPGSAVPPGEFIEYDYDEEGRFAPVQRPAATNTAGIVVGMIRNRTERYPEGMERVILLGDPTRSLGSLAEPECIRIIDALDLADHLQVPCEWFALSAGAKIAMDSGTENMDWVAAVLRRIVRFTQAGGEINVVVSGINVGAQPYWNAEATMLMHTKGILVMTPESAMVLTGKQALDYSGGVSAEDNFGIGGQERIMGPNGQAQYRASDHRGRLRGAAALLRARLRGAG